MEKKVKDSFSIRRFLIKLLPLFIIELIAPYIGTIVEFHNQTYWRLYNAKKQKGAGILIRRT